MSIDPAKHTPKKSKKVMLNRRRTKIANESRRRNRKSYASK